MPGGMKLCLGCRRLGRWPSHGRCDPCYAEHKSKYDAEYRATRHRAERDIKSGAAFNCPRCGEPIEPDDAWDLGHQGDGTLMPEHRHRKGACPGNRAAGARKGKVHVRGIIR